MSTPQEDQLYEAFTNGDVGRIEELRDAVTDAEEVQQFNLDYQNAWMHYQKDNETPAEERVQATAEVVQTENENAPVENSEELNET